MLFQGGRNGINKGKDEAASVITAAIGGRCGTRGGRVCQLYLCH